MKLLVVILLSVNAVCGLNVLKRLKRDSYVIGGAENTDTTTSQSMVYIDAGITKCSGVCISKRVVLTCGACARAAASPTSIKLYSGPSKTAEGTIKEVRYTRDKEVAMIILERDKELTACKPVLLPCKKKYVPTLEEPVLLSGWGMTSMTPETDATNIQAVQMKWSGANACCAGITSITTDGTKNICMTTTMPTQATCYGDCGAPVFKWNRVVGIIIRNYPNCELNKCSVAANIFPLRDELLGPQGASAVMEDLFSPKVDEAPEIHTGELPYTVSTPKGCIPIDVKFRPNAKDAACNTKKTMKPYNGLPTDTKCEETKVQRAGLVIRGTKIRCNAKLLEAANGCPCCKKGTIKYRCYKPCVSP